MSLVAQFVICDLLLNSLVAADSDGSGDTVDKMVLVILPTVLTAISKPFSQNKFIQFHVSQVVACVGLGAFVE